MLNWWTLLIVVLASIACRQRVDYTDTKGNDVGQLRAPAPPVANIAAQRIVARGGIAPALTAVIDGQQSGHNENSHNSARPNKQNTSIGQTQSSANPSETNQVEDSHQSQDGNSQDTSVGESDVNGYGSSTTNAHDRSGCFEKLKKDDCNATYSCGWSASTEKCLNLHTRHCPYFPDRVFCIITPGCRWSNHSCKFQ
jgi:hypothetical protein